MLFLELRLETHFFIDNETCECEKKPFHMARFIWRFDVIIGVRVMYCVSTVEKRNDCIGDGFSTFFLFSHILTGPIFGELVRMVQFEGFSSSHLSTFDFQCEQPATLVDSYLSSWLGSTSYSAV